MNDMVNQEPIKLENRQNIFFFWGFSRVFGIRALDLNGCNLKFGLIKAEQQKKRKRKTATSLVSQDLNHNNKVAEIKYHWTLIINFVYIGVIEKEKFCFSYLFHSSKRPRMCMFL